MTVQERVEFLRKKMRESGIHAYIVPSSDPHQSEYVARHWACREWISGFTGSAGTAVIGLDFAHLWTDGRYFLQAEEELADGPFELQKMNIPYSSEYTEWLAENLEKGQKVGCDGWQFSESQVANLEQKLIHKGKSLRPDLDLIGKIWEDRPPLPDRNVFAFDIKYSGQSRADKLSTLREKMADYQADAHIVSSLDDIAWILNLRGADVPCNPVFYAYLLIGEKDAVLFVGENKVPAEIQEQLKADAVELKPYNDFIQHIERIQGSIWIDRSISNHAIAKGLSGREIIDAQNHSTLLKAQKNETEVKHIRDVMRKDAVALTKMYRWLEKTLDERTVPEVEVAEKLDHFRDQVGDYHGESFNAIIGYKGNGAIIHYRAKPETCADIQKEGMLLVDSGGQYTQGTTDITRTTHLGTPTPEEKQHYTLVLKGHIALDRLVFPEGTRGNQIDAFARRDLWAEGLDYRHGTGHGVGYFLNVHEAPHGIGPGGSGKYAHPILRGMFTSNEPGYYKDGEYGIRIENLVLAVVESEGPYGTFLKFESLTLFPIDTELLDLDLLSQAEVDWLNTYHRRVFEEVSPLMDEDDKSWLRQKCAAIAKG